MHWVGLPYSEKEGCQEFLRANRNAYLQGAGRNI